MATKPDQVTPTAGKAGVGGEEMERYGITRVPVDYFHVGEYRYTVLADAVAQAKREGRGS